MKIITYSNKKFSSDIKYEISKGNDTYIKLSKTWNSNLITQYIINLMTDEKSEEKSWKFIFCIFPNPSFFCLFYAHAQNYRITKTDENEKLIKLKNIGRLIHLKNIIANKI